MIKIDTALCINCELCVKSCPTKAIHPDRGEVNDGQCMGCSHCVSICPKDAVTQDDIGSVYIDEHNISPKDFENLIYTRKSIRNFKDIDIDDKTLTEFLNLMEYSPTGTNSQQTYITVIKGRDRISKISKSLILYFQKIARLFLTPITKPFLTLTLGKEKTAKFFSYKEYILNLKEGEDILTYNSPLVVLFHASAESTTPDMDSNIQSAYASLHAVTLGLGTCFNGFITRGLNGNKKLKKEIGIPKNHKLYSCLLVGYPALKYKKRVIREDLKVNILS